MLRDQLNLVSDSQSTDVILSQLPVIESSEIAIGAIEIVQEMALLFAGDLNPVAPKAQKKVQIPEGLSLDEWINTPPAESSESSEDEQTDLFVSHEQMEHSDRKTKSVELTAEEIMKLREVRKIEQSHNPNYLKSTTKPNQIVKDGCEDIPIAELALEVPLKITCEYMTTGRSVLNWTVDSYERLSHFIATKRSDKYLQDDQLGSKKKTKKTKKTKKSKHKLGISSESDGEGKTAVNATMINEIS